MPEPATLFGVVLLGLVAAAAVRLYLRDARAYRAGRGDELYAWLRRSHPDHPALPSAPPERVLRTLPRRWGWRHVLIAMVQAGTVCALTWFSFWDTLHSDPANGAKILAFNFVIWTILVAFSTAVLTRLWDLSRAGLAGRRAGARQGDEAGGEADGVLAARRRLRQGP